MPNHNSSHAAFNLVDQPWIPVAGKTKLLSLLDIFTGPPPERLSGNAVDKIVMFRFLLSIVHASSSIPDEAAWHALTPEKLAENARNYLTAHKDCFDLYDPERPFLQFPQLKEKGKEDSCSSLQVNVASGNKVVLTEWNLERSLSDPEKAVLLLRSTGYACGGKKYDSTVVLSPGFEKGKSGHPGTLLGAFGYLHTYMTGRDLWDSLRRNLLTSQEIEHLGCYPAGLGEPCWQRMPQGEEDSNAKQYKRSYFGRLMPLDKFLLLTENGIIKTDGIPYNDPKAVPMDPAVTVYPDKKENKTIWANTEKRPWRQLSAMLNFLQNNTKSPFFLSVGLQHLRGESPDKIGIWTGGAAIKANSGEQYMSGPCDYVESEFALPFVILKQQDQWLTSFKELMVELDNRSKILYAAVSQYHKLMNNQTGGDLASQAAARFWERMESHAQTIINLADAPAEDALKAEKLTWAQVVDEIYNDSCPNETARQMTAWVEANPKFNRKKGKNKNGK
ncbi:MAG: type I-E CRISPR-associated protein Cse1/CasA [Lentisphaeria bacterium]|nr:type I-E CRISPR-associated protein Cse1/CasA [Lentisphaeria bacterium]